MGSHLGSNDMGEMESHGPPARPSALQTRERQLDPFPWYREMREESPVRYDDQRETWDVFRYADVHDILHDPETFSSERPLTAELDTQFGDITGELIINTDPPRHRKLRAIVDEPFTPGAVKRLAPHIHDITTQLLDTAVGEAGGETDLVEALATPLPVTVIAELLGVPTADRDQFKQWSDTIVESPDAGDTDALYEQQQQAQLEMGQYFIELVEQRREDPQDDLITTVIDTEIDGNSPSETEILGVLALLLIAGNITTTNLITNAVLRFSQLPNGIDDVQNLGSLELAIEEVLRHSASVQAVSRVATTDTTVGEQQLAEGDRVVVWIGSANRDEQRFKAPETFIPDRSPNPHLTFGSGIHFCLGAHLARLEARVALSTLFEGYTQITVPDRARTPVESAFLYSVQHLPVRLTP